MSIHTLRKRFVKDQGLPITVVQDPYFNYYLELYDPLYDCKQSYKSFILEVRKTGGIQAFLASYYKIRDQIIADLKQNEAYVRFSNDSMNHYLVQNTLPKTDIFRPNHDGELFFSIDLKQANFHAMRFYDEGIFNGATTYEEWLGHYTTSSYMHQSKYLRQVIFGNVNPKKQVTIEKYIIAQFIDAVLNIVPLENIRNASHDEIVVLQPETLDFATLENAVLSVSQTLGVPVRIEHFRLRKQGTQSELGYVKESVTGAKPIFKSVPGIFMPQAFKYYFQQPIQQEDLVFFHEGQLAAFLQPLNSK